MTTTYSEAAQEKSEDTKRHVLLKGLPTRALSTDWSGDERDWLEGQCRIVAAMRRELTIAAGGYHTLCALQRPHPRVLDDIAARLPQFQHIVAVHDGRTSARLDQPVQDSRCTTTVTHPASWLLKQPTQGRMFLFFDPDAALSSRVPLSRLLKKQTQQSPCAYALISPGQQRSAFSNALRDRGHALCWQESALTSGGHWHLSLWRTTQPG